MCLIIVYKYTFQKKVLRKVLDYKLCAFNLISTIYSVWFYNICLIYTAPILFPGLLDFSFNVNYYFNLFHLLTWSN